MNEEEPSKTTNVLSANSRRHVNKEDNIVCSIMSNWRLRPESLLTSKKSASRADVPETHIGSVQPRGPNPCYASLTHSSSVADSKTASDVWQRNAASDVWQRNAASNIWQRNAAPYGWQRNAAPNELLRNVTTNDLQHNAAPNDMQQNAASTEQVPNDNARRNLLMPFADQAHSAIRASSRQRKPMKPHSLDDYMQRDLSEEHGVSEYVETDVNENR